MWATQRLRGALAVLAMLGWLAAASAGASTASQLDGGTVRVPGGIYLLGVTEAEMLEATAECAAATKEELCYAYATMLSLMGVREVALAPFEIDRLEVSRGAYRRCVMAGRCGSRPLWIGVPASWTEAHPITYVTWFDAQAYCEAQGMRLPTEAEWEAAARGADRWLWPWGMGAQGARFNHGGVLRGALARVLGEERDSLRITSLPDDGDGHAGLAARGSYPLGQGPFGTLDQAGNVAEWTADSWHERGYEGLPGLSPRRHEGHGGKRVVRGGSWLQPAYVGQSNLRDPHNLLDIYDAGEARPDVGFRCAR